MKQNCLKGLGIFKSNGVFIPKITQGMLACFFENSFKDIEEYPEYYDCLDCLCEFNKYYMMFAYLCNFKQGLSGLEPVTKKQIIELIVKTQEYKEFCNGYKNLESKLRNRNLQDRLIYLDTKKVAFDNYMERAIYSYMFLGYRDGCWLNEKISPSNIDEKDIKKLEKHYQNQSMVLTGSDTLEFFKDIEIIDVY